MATAHGQEVNTDSTRGRLSTMYLVTGHRLPGGPWSPAGLVLDLLAFLEVAAAATGYGAEVPQGPRRRRLG